MAGTVVQRYVSEFLNKEVKEYALYVVRTRALPNIMDGQRVGARKILYAALKSKKFNPTDKNELNAPETKMVNMIGDTMGIEWNHGDASLKKTIEQLASKYYNEFCPFEVEGQMGTLREPNINTAARYLMVRRTKFLQMFEHSSDLWKFKIDDGVKVEPHFYTPILPISLLYRTIAPGFGFGFRSFSYSADDIINSIINVLQFDTCTGMYWSHIRPTISGIKQKNIIYNSNIETYYNVGEYELIDANTIKIKDLPFNMYYDKYEKHLDKLKEIGTIKNWENLTRGDDTNFRIKFNSGQLRVLVKQKLKFFKLLKLYTKIPKDNLNLIDVDGETIINFTDSRELIDGFVKRRLVVYENYRLYMENKYKEICDDLQNRINFINLFVDKKIELRLKSKENILLQCEKLGYDFTYYIDDLLKLTLSRLTQKEIDKSIAKFKEIQELYYYFKKVNNKTLYFNDLIEFKSKYCEPIIKK